MLHSVYLEWQLKYVIIIHISLININFNIVDINIAAVEIRF